jgi:hypothetical protein
MRIGLRSTPDVFRRTATDVHYGRGIPLLVRTYVRASSNVVALYPASIGLQRSGTD